jgi:alpha-methylacyl-CoA racemase
LQPGRAPRFSGTDAALPTPPPALGADTRDVLTAAGVDADALLRAGVAAQAER